MCIFQDWNALSLSSDPSLLLLALYFGSALRADQLSSLRGGCAEGCPDSRFYQKAVQCIRVGFGAEASSQDWLGRRQVKYIFTIPFAIWT